MTTLIFSSKIKINHKKQLKNSAIKNILKVMNDRYIAYLKSDEWAQLKIDLFKQRGKKCEKCGSIKSIAVHHLTYKNIYAEEPSDLIILCNKCHEKEHGILKKKKNKKHIKIVSLAQKLNLKKTSKIKYKEYKKLLLAKNN